MSAEKNKINVIINALITVKNNEHIVYNTIHDSLNRDFILASDRGMRTFTVVYPVHDYHRYMVALDRSCEFIKALSKSADFINMKLDSASFSSDYNRANSHLMIRPIPAIPDAVWFFTYDKKRKEVNLEK